MLNACRDVNEFEKISRLGEGTYGIVYQVGGLSLGEGTCGMCTWWVG